MIDSSTFPDLVHIHQIKRELWRWPASRASVMIGAGISLNSKALPGVSSKFPTWSQLVRAMFDELYPIAFDEKSKQQQDVIFYAMQPLQIASEYEAAFGRYKLEALIKQLNPDLEHQPGKLHTSILELPWNDVFTTNYDTLLERTIVTGRAYSTVTKSSELTSATTPRIIKLHGSLPSQTPFIITEDDYRTYPKRFAPLVNTVQQSLIENCFILLGFSGDDPNFLQWSGWIRDELGENHAPIYLVGYLRLSTAKRHLLVKKGITPVDLSPLINGDEICTNPHTKCIETFLQLLADAKPQTPNQWDKGIRRKSPESGGLSLTDNTENLKPIDYCNLAPDKDTQAIFCDLYKWWKHLRQSYPGWVIAPDSTRASIWQKTNSWCPYIAKSINEWNIYERLLLLEEFNWRYELALAPLTPQQIAPFELAFNEFYTLAIASVPKPTSEREVFASIDLPEVIEAWLKIGLGLLRESREMFDFDRWESLNTKILTISKKYDQPTSELSYEHCLKYVWNFELVEAKKELDGWDPPHNSPHDLIKKASLLGELDLIDEAEQLLQAALLSIREGLRQQGRNISLLSLEGWCLALLSNFEIASSSYKYKTNLRDEFSERWEELKAWDCNPWSYITYFNNILHSPFPSEQKLGRTTVTGFDPGRKQTSFVFSNERGKNLLPAFACLRHYEIVGIPVRLRTVDMSTATLSKACMWINSSINGWAPAILARTGKPTNFDELGILTRSSIYRMKTDLALRLYDWALKGFAAEVSTVTNHSIHSRSRTAMLTSLVEVLSRLCFRVDDNKLSSTFDISLSLHKHISVIPNRDLNKCNITLLRRLCAASSEKNLLTWLPDLLTFPTPDLGETDTLYDHDWGDPMSVFPARGSIAKRSIDSNLKNRIINSYDRLAKNIESATGKTRDILLMRMSDVYFSYRLDKTRQQLFAKLLWSEQRNGLPATNHYYFSFFNLPSSEEVNVAKRIKDSIKILNPNYLASITSGANITTTMYHREPRMLYELDTCTKDTLNLAGNFAGQLTWSRKEALEVWQKVLTWWENDKVLLPRLTSDEHLASDFSGEAESLREVIHHISRIFDKIITPNLKIEKDSEIIDSILEIITECYAHDVHLTHCLVLLSEQLNRQDLIPLNKIENGLLDDNPHAFKAAVFALRIWIKISIKSEWYPAPSNEVILNLINRVIYRRKACLTIAIYELCHIMTESPNSVSFAMEAILNSMFSWLEAVDINSSIDTQAEFDDESLPEMRAQVATLITALIRCWKKLHPKTNVDSRLLAFKNICENDILPEVRAPFRNLPS